LPIRAALARGPVARRRDPRVCSSLSPTAVPRLSGLNRFEYGYGLTPEIVELVKLEKPDLIITVDNGIASIDGVQWPPNSGGASKVLVTDHHLPAHELPAADADRESESAR